MRESNKGKMSFHRKKVVQGHPSVALLTRWSIITNKDTHTHTSTVYSSNGTAYVGSPHTLPVLISNSGLSEHCMDEN